MRLINYEEWQIIPGHENYLASNFGRIKNATTGKILSQSNSKGYKQLNVGKKYGAKKVHRLILSAFKAVPENGKISCHTNDKKNDNRIENLYWGTYSDNQNDSVKNGKHNGGGPRGLANGASKFSDDIIKKVKSEYTGEWGQQTKLSKKYGICQQHVSLIVRDKRRAA